MRISMHFPPEVVGQVLTIFQQATAASIRVVTKFHVTNRSTGEMIMRTLVKAAVLIGLLAAALLGTAGTSSAAANPYTPQEACRNETGRGGWSVVSDGHRQVVTPTGAKWGDVYLLYSGGYNCVATIKSSFVGTRTWTEAWIRLEGGNWIDLDSDPYSYYAAGERNAAGVCVAYFGRIYNNPNHTGTPAEGGRAGLGNCG
jgi:hypothetical protein